MRSGFARNRTGGSGGSIIFETKARPSDVIANDRWTAAASGTHVQIFWAGGR